MLLHSFIAISTRIGVNEYKTGVITYIKGALNSKSRELQISTITDKSILYTFPILIS